MQVFLPGSIVLDKPYLDIRMYRFLKRLHRYLQSLSPETKQMIIGAGLANDPLPEPRNKTFQRDDRLALQRDREAVCRDMWTAVDRANKTLRHRK